MKKFSKILSVALLVALVLSLGVASAFAEDPVVNDSITINNAKAGETYNLYKMFDLVVDDESKPEAFSYKVNSAWKTFFEGDGAKYITVNDAGYITEIKDNAGAVATDSKDLATAAAAWSGKPTATKSVTVAEGATTASFADLADGYYLITSTLGTFAMADTTPSKNAVTINEKNPDDTIDKEVKEDSTGNYGSSNDAQVGDTVEFKSVLKVVPRSINVKVHDTMDPGLTLNASSIKVYSDAELTTEYTGATVRAGTDTSAPDSGDTFTIDIPDSFAASATADQYLYIVYTAVLNENAVVKDGNGQIVVQNNKTKVTWGDSTGSEYDTTTTTTYKFEVLKYQNGDKTKRLAGATFKVQHEVVAQDGTKSWEDLKLIKIDDTNFRIAKAGETGAVDTFTTVDTANTVIWGVDNDKYQLIETEAPSGFNKLKDPVDVTVGTANSFVAEVNNQSGTELPSTGGIGTTIFYVVGGVLVLAAIILLVTKKRMSE